MPKVAPGAFVALVKRELGDVPAQLLVPLQVVLSRRRVVAELALEVLRRRHFASWGAFADWVKDTLKQVQGD